MIQDVQSNGQLREKHLHGLLLCQLLATTLISLQLNLEMCFHYVIIGLIFKHPCIVMDVENNLVSNMLRIVKKVDLSPSAIMKCEML